MKRLYFLNIALLFYMMGTFQLLQAQTKAEIHAKVAAIKANPKYLWGEGHGNTLKTARDVARSDIANSIITTIESRTAYRISDDSKQGYSEEFIMAVQTYSSATLYHLTEIIEEDKPGAAKVFIYILRSEVYEVFAQRKNKIFEYIREAEKAEKGSQIADAIRGFYWAQTLLRSLPRPSEVRYIDVEGEERVLTQWLPQQLVRIFSGIKISVLKVDKDKTKQMIDLKISYNGIPVVNFDYSYRSGKEWTKVGAKDGRGCIVLDPNEDVANLTIQAEYEFAGLSVWDEELKSVLDRLESVPYPQSRYDNIPMEDTNWDSVIFQSNQRTIIQRKEDIQDHYYQKISDSASYYMNVMHKIEYAIESRQYDSVKAYFDENGFDMFTKLINYGRAELYGRADYRLEKSSEGVICRSLPLIFNFSGERTFIEDIVFVFDQNGLINGLSFELSKKTLADINTHEYWPIESRNAIIRFLENYKTAYALKKLDYISRIFSNEALIITGTVLRSYERLDAMTVRLRENIRLREQTKEDYLRNLRMCFANNEYINIQFTETLIRKGDISCGELYGIQIKQDYYSSTYGDRGYLFLMVDLNNEEEPIIHVRAWQPEKDPEFGQIGMEHFTVR